MKRFVERRALEDPEALTSDEVLNVDIGKCNFVRVESLTELPGSQEYSKTDGLEYICPNCSTANGRLTKRRKVSNSADGAEAAISKGVPRRRG